MSLGDLLLKASASILAHAVTNLFVRGTLYTFAAAYMDIFPSKHAVMACFITSLSQMLLIHVGCGNDMQALDV